MATPDYGQYLGEIWGWPNEGASGFFAGASNIVIGTNPPYGAFDFFKMKPKFFGTPASITGTLTSGSTTVSAVSSMTGLAAGQLIVGDGIPPGTTITTIGSGTLTISTPAITAGTGVAISVYVAPLVPLAVINVYIALASASLVQARYLEAWTVAMSLYIGHFLTMWLLSEGDVYSTPGAAASAGLAQGIVTSKTVGPVSIGSTMLDAGLQDWGAWQLTKDGQLLATMAKTVGMGTMLIW